MMISKYKLMSAVDTFGLKGSFLLALDYLKNLPLKDKVKTLPRSIQVENTTLCNLRCEMCPINELERSEMKNLTFEEFKKIMKNFDYWHSLRLWGIGEPFINPEVFKMIKYEKDRGNFVNVSTNLNLLNKRLIQKISDYKVDNLILSIDGGTKSSYETIRRGAKWEKMIENLVHIRDLIIDKKRKPNVRITTIAMKKTISGLKNVIKLASDYHIKTVIVQELVDSSDKESVADDLTAKEELKNIVRFGRSHGVNVVVPDLKVRTKRERCVSPWLQVYITVSGDVTPCCRNISKKYYTCGNLFEESFKEIWNNKRYRSFRKALRDGPIPKICEGCTTL